MSASLGGLLKDYRLQKNIPQLEIAYEVGWKDATILSRIEQGVTKTPSREIIDKICLAMNLEEAEKNYILLAGGYIPTDSELIEIRAKLNPIINQSKYPINIGDFAWRLLGENEAAKLVHYATKEDELALAEKNDVYTLELTFNTRYAPSKLLLNTNDQDEFLTSIVSQFLFENKDKKHHKWYISQMKRLMNIPKFREIYTNATAYPQDKIILDFATQKVTHRKDPLNILTFNMFNVPIYYDRRIYLEYLIPADSKTFEFYENLD